MMGGCGGEKGLTFFMHSNIASDPAGRLSFCPPQIGPEIDAAGNESQDYSAAILRKAIQSGCSSIRTGVRLLVSTTSSCSPGWLPLAIFPTPPSGFRVCAASATYNIRPSRIQANFRNRCFAPEENDFFLLGIAPALCKRPLAKKQDSRAEKTD